TLFRSQGIKLKGQASASARTRLHRPLGESATRISRFTGQAGSLTGASVYAACGRHRCGKPAAAAAQPDSSVEQSAVYWPIG
ncbi:MAG: hypothetical protein K2Q20_07700, partial [Phycisphaerales bacterium]|nr:hypothetical protein [Phycisphaerales bacterium]